MTSIQSVDKTLVKGIYNIWNPNNEALAAEFWQNNNRKGFSPVCANKFKYGCRIGKNGKNPCSDCPIKEPVFVNEQILADHIIGKKRYGIYTPLKNDIVYWVAADIDGHTEKQNPYQDVKKLIEVCYAIGDIPLQIFSSNSGKGYHCYIFFEGTIPAYKARTLMIALTDRIEGDKNAVDCIFPKQDYFQGITTGNLIALPWSGEAVKKRQSTLFLDRNTLKPYAYEIDLCANIEYFFDEFNKINETDIDSLLKIMGINFNKPTATPRPSKKQLNENITHKLIDKCKFLQHCKEDAANLPEPHWYMMICILAREFQGPSIIHSLSKPYSNYSKKETDAKISHALNDQPGPVTCKTIKSIWDCGKNCGVVCPVHLLNKQKKYQPVSNYSKYNLIIKAGNLPQEVDFCQDIMRKEQDIYERGGELFRPVFVKDFRDNKIKRNSSNLILQKVTPDYLLLYLSSKINFYKQNKKNEIVNCNCPKNIVDSICANTGNWDLNYISGILETPTITPYGRIIDKSGYDSSTCLLLINDHNIKIEVNPDNQEVIKAKSIIHEVISEYPFETELDYSVAFAAILTSVVRRVLPTTPFFAIDATKNGSGKSLLAECIAIIATGKAPPLINLPPYDPKEEEKRFDSVLMAGDSIIVIDNIEHQIKSERLCTIGTQTIVSARILGFSKVLNLPSNSMWMFTGNNLSFAGDITRRVLKCRIDPKVENPEERTFKKNCKEYTINNRSKIIESIITILKSYLQATNKPKLSPYGSYDEWSKFIRGACIWLGLHDPVEAKKNIQNEDPGKIKLISLLETWYELFGSEPTTVKEFIEILNNDKTYKEIAENFSKDGNINARILGNFIAKNRGRIENGKSFIQKGIDRTRAKKWAISI